MSPFWWNGWFMLFLSCFLLCFRAPLFIDAWWSPAGKGLTSWLSFVVSNCDVVTFLLVSWVRCGAWLYRFLIFALFLTFCSIYISMAYCINYHGRLLYYPVPIYTILDLNISINLAHFKFNVRLPYPKLQRYSLDLLHTIFSPYQFYGGGISLFCSAFNIGVAFLDWS